ncbi:MAG: hypothetical protein DMG58_16315 [Acidobacteria bacterium]|nr:MAG: hypothetical protein DMG58_16315 [Acidobacteriota bacterium]
MPVLFILIAMAMIPLVEPARNEYLAELERKGKNNFFRMMAHKPEVLKSFVPLYGAIMGPGAADRRTKELVYLAVSFANECAYCLAAHRASAKKAGITEEEIRAMETEQYQDFSEPERAVIQYARELTAEASANVSGEALYKNFNDEQVVEITLVAAIANFTNRFNNGLGVQPEH